MNQSPSTPTQSSGCNASARPRRRQRNRDKMSGSAASMSAAVTSCSAMAASSSENTINITTYQALSPTPVESSCPTTRSPHAGLFWLRVRPGQMPGAASPRMRSHHDPLHPRSVTPVAFAPVGVLRQQTDVVPVNSEVIARRHPRPLAQVVAPCSSQLGRGSIRHADRALLAEEQGQKRPACCCSGAWRGWLAREAVPALTAALRGDPDVEVRRQAALSLGGLGAAAESALPELEKFSKEPDRCASASTAIKNIRR